MTNFEAEKFDDKYVHYMDELQTAYRNAYQHFHGRYDSTLLKAIDRRVLDESEPFYEGDGEFRVELPDDPRERAGDLPVSDETFDAVLQEFVDRIERELRQIFEFEES